MENHLQGHITPRKKIIKEQKIDIQVNYVNNKKRM